MFTHLIRKDLRKFSPYSSARSENLVGNIWLNANESPWDESDEFLNRYPEQQSQELLQKLSHIYQIDEGQLLITRGSDEGIDLLVRLFCEAGKDAIMACTPTFGMYRICAQIQGAEYISAPLLADNNFQIDMEKIQSLWQENVKILFACSPNNPTGNILKKEFILSLATKMANKSILVIDEAYIEFSETQSLVSEIKNYPNLIILRTLSKAFGLAGSRIGCLLANAQLISSLKAIMPPYPLAKPAISSAIAGLSADKYQHTMVKIDKIKKERDILITTLPQLNIVEKVWSSDANFILIKFKKDIMQYCLNQGIVIRSLAKTLGCNKTFRISIGTEIENKKLLEILKAYSE